jgi:hypothetical protein
MAAMNTVPVVILAVILAFAFPSLRGAIGAGVAVAVGGAIGFAAKQSVFVRRLHRLRQSETADV